MARRRLRDVPESPFSGAAGHLFTIKTGFDIRATLAGYSNRGQQTVPYTTLLVSLSGLYGVEVISIARSVTPSHYLQFSAAVASATTAFVLHLRNCSPGATRWSARQRGAMLLGQGAATYLPLLVSGIMWAGMTGFFAGSVLLLVAGWKAWVPFAAIALSGFAAVPQGPLGIAFLVISGSVWGLVVFALSRLTLLLRHEHIAQAKVSQLAAVKERTRFAMDLHDLLGYSLSAIALKAELSRRVMDTKPELAREELADVVTFARQAVADVRLVANRYRTMSLAVEAASAASVLAAAGVMADIEIDCGALDEKVDTVLATIVREAVTNLLRHSSARSCRIAASQAGESVTLLVANDGAPGPEAGYYRDGGGLENLTARLESIGGTLTIESQDGRFGLIAAVPHTARGGTRASPGRDVRAHE
jgi:two-component system, NarL family, sensor histidine kinase DesK